MSKHVKAENLKVRVDANDKAALEKLARENERSVGAEIRLAIRHHLLKGRATQ